MTTVVMPRVRYLFEPPNKAADAARRRNQGTCVLHSQSSFRIMWDVILLFLLMYISFVTPVRIGFELYPIQYTGWWWFEITIDVTFILDLILNFRTTYINSDGKEVTKGNEIACNYLHGWFWIDFISSIPFDLIVSYALGISDYQSNEIGNVQVSKTLKISKSARISKLSKIARVLKLTKLVRLARATRLMSRYADMFYISRNQMKLIQLFFATLTIAHFIACGWGLVAHLHDDVDRNSWLVASDMIDREGTEQYLTAFYWSVTTMITVGYGDVHPTNKEERLYTIFAVIIGGGYYGYIIASVASLVASWDMHQKAYHERMDEVATYMQVRKFPRDLYRKMRRYFRHFYSKAPSVDEKGILISLSTTLRKEVIEFLISDIRGKILKGIPMFAELQGAQLAQLLRILRPLQAEEGQHIITTGEIGTEMFILMNGELCVQNDHGDIFGRLSAGACFGELTMLGLQEERTATIVATEFSELYSLRRSDIFDAFVDSPEVLDRMVLRAAKKSQATYVANNGGGREEEDQNGQESQGGQDGQKDGGQKGGGQKQQIKRTRSNSCDSHSSILSFISNTSTDDSVRLIKADDSNCSSILKSTAKAVHVVQTTSIMDSRSSASSSSSTASNDTNGDAIKTKETNNNIDQIEAERQAKKAMEAMTKQQMPRRSSFLAPSNPDIASELEAHRKKQQEDFQVIMERMNALSDAVNIKFNVILEKLDQQTTLKMQKEEGTT